MAEPEPYIELVDGIAKVFTQHGLETMGKLVATLPATEYVETYPISKLRLPPRNLDDVLPAGWALAELHPYWDSFLDAERSGDYSELGHPEGLDRRVLATFFKRFWLFLCSEARGNRDIEKSVAFMRAALETFGEFIEPVIIHEDGRVIHGLTTCWALMDMGTRDTLPVVILRGAPVDAGYFYAAHDHHEWMSGTWNLAQRKRAWETADPEVQELFKSYGSDWSSGFAVLTCTEATLDRLGVLVRKQLGTKGKLDPAQLLYVESLREAVLDMRQKMVRDGKTDGDVVAKLELHLKEEKDALARGAKIEAKNGWRWDVDSDGMFFHPALKRYRFKIVESASPVETLTRTYQPDQSRLMSADQFRLLAQTHFGLDSGEAANLYEQLTDDVFNQRLRAYVSNAPEVAPKVRGLPTDEERVRQAERLALFDA